MVRPGARLGDIGHAIQSYVEAQGYSVVREYCGHGIGRVFHEDPQVLHYGEPGTGLVLEAGMTFTVEPMVNAGKRHVKLLPDGWTVVTKDHSLSAQWEHTILVTASGVRSADARRSRSRRYLGAPPMRADLPLDAPDLLATVQEPSPPWDYLDRLARRLDAPGDADRRVSRGAGRGRRRPQAAFRGGRADRTAGARPRADGRRRSCSAPGACTRPRTPPSWRWSRSAATAAASCIPAPTSTSWCCCPRPRRRPGPADSSGS